ncbi:MAG: hypothetical protein J5J00_09515 [Deltaproteobacteria bacterium]|nr:hypothetical protein [Deltaproteobacteria bacterium]
MKSGNVYLAKFTVGIAAILLAAGLVTSCGGNPDDTVTIEGTILSSNVTRTSHQDETLLPQSDATICCFDRCDITDQDGFFSFGAIADSFPGGDVLCNVSNGALVEQPFLVNDIVPNPEAVLMRITIRNGVVTAEVLDQTSGNISQPPISPTQNPDATTLPEATEAPVEPQPTAAPEATPIDPLPERTPTPLPPEGCFSLFGSYTGNGGCGFGSQLNVTNSGDTIILNPLGSNGATSFDASIFPQTPASISTDLTVFNQAGHTCNLECEDGNVLNFTLRCENAQGGSCTETYTAD